MNHKLRILLIAEAANPEWSSVPLEGWSHSQAIARLAEVHLITQVRNREAIIRAGLKEGLDFTAINSEKIAAPISKLASLLRGGNSKGWTTLVAMESISYYYFERLVWKQFGSRIKAREFDIVHRLTPLTPTSPSLLARKCFRVGVPFVVGPLNGGLPWPRAFDSVRRAEREWLSYVRGAYKLLPGYHSMRRSAAAIIVGSQETLRQMPQRYRDKCIYIAENAIDPKRFTLVRTRRAGRPLKLIFVGRLVPYKGADMVLEAAAPLMQRGEVVVEIVGQGPQEPELRALIDRLGIVEFTSLSGWLPHQQLQSKLIEADLLCFPSIREFGGAVVLEAMAVGLVPMVVRYGGPAELVTESTGFFIELGSRQQIVAELQRALSELVVHPEQIDAKSPPARKRALDEFTWEAKAQSVLAVYDKIMSADHA